LRQFAKNLVILLLASHTIQLSTCLAAAPTMSSTPNESSSQEASMTLKEQLQELAARSKAKMPEQTTSVMKNSLDEIQKSGVIDRALKVGQRAPDFALPNAKNKTISLKEILAKGPAVVSFYRGGWCPYCNLSLHALQASLPQIEANGATLVAVSPQLPDQSLSTAEKDALTFEVLSDVGNTVAKEFGIAYQLPSELAKLTKGFGVDLAKYNGDGSNELPLAATYIVREDGTIEYAFVDVDYKKRMEPSDIVAVLKHISTQDKQKNKHG
jgi:peroxiredoxin